jgi:Flp pilus assembly protein TadD
MADRDGADAKSTESPDEVATSLTSLACSLEVQGRTAEATKAYRQALLQSPHLGIANTNLGYLILIRGNTAGSVACLQRAVDAPSTQVPGELVLPSFHAEALPGSSGSDADVRASLACHLLGVKLQEAGRFEEAKSCFMHSIRLFNGNGSAYYALVNAEKVKDPESELVRDMQAVLTRSDIADADRGQLCFALGKAMDDLGEYERAIRYFDEANRIASLQPNAAFDRAGFKDYVDAVIRAYPRQRMADLKDGGSQSELPLVIVGMLRSGTTLVEQIVSSHPRVAAGGEMEFWRDYGSKHLLSGREIPASESSRISAAYLTELRRIGPEALRVTDKMPQNFVAIGLIHELFPNARVVCCQRNAVDTCLSIYMTSFKHPLQFVNRREDIVFFYRQFARMMDHWRKAIPANRLLDLNYEELLLDREATTRRLIAFCGLDWDDRCLHPESNRRTVKTASVWQVRQPVYTSSSERWRNYEPWLGEFNSLLP